MFSYVCLSETSFLSRGESVDLVYGAALVLCDSGRLKWHAEL
jgi:hypothetical protein